MDSIATTNFLRLLAWVFAMIGVFVVWVQWFIAVSYWMFAFLIWFAVKLIEKKENGSGNDNENTNEST